MMRMAWLKNVFVVEYSHRQKAAQMEGDGFLPQENCEYAPIYEEFICKNRQMPNPNILS
jgi:hypothetical protein